MLTPSRIVETKFIPAGYQVTITTQGLNPSDERTIVLDGLIKADVEFLVEVVSLLYPDELKLHHNNFIISPKPSYFGNLVDIPEYDDAAEMLDKLLAICIRKYLAKSSLAKQFGSDDAGIDALFVDLELRSGSLRCRALKSLQVLLVPKPIELDVVTNLFYRIEPKQEKPDDYNT
jgi:hypothetical protein